MTLEETVDLLTAAAAFDRRTIGEGDAIAWHAAVGDLRLADCRDAVIAHYRRSRDFVMPSDVRQGVREVRDARLRRTEIPAPPRETLDDPEAYSAALRSATVAIADGRDPHEAVRETLTALKAGRRKELGAA